MTSCIGFLISMFRTRMCGQTLLFIVIANCAIDYCNAVLAALPRSTIESLQRVQNTAARLVFGLQSHDHITLALSTSALPH